MPQEIKLKQNENFPANKSLQQLGIGNTRADNLPMVTDCQINLAC